ncbi:MAG: recombinase family protein [Planctomycetota bacterium]|nr:MAG: recombinase family protein [Planctomycetota bacterium]
MTRSDAQRTAVGYARTGPDEEDARALSLDEQQGLIRAYAAFRRMELERIYTDVGVAGSVPVEARAGGAQLLERIQGPHTGLDLLVVRLERLFSSAAECVDFHEAFEQQATVLHVLDLDGSAVASDSAAGHLMLAVLRAARDMEAEQARHRARSLLKARRARKGAKPLLGEKIVRGYIVPDPVEMHAVRRISELARQGKSLRLIAEALDQEGIPTKRRAKGWSKEAIRLILKRIERNEVRDLRGRSAEADEIPPVGEESS